MKKSCFLLILFACVYPSLWWGGRLPGEWCLVTHPEWVLLALALLALAPEKLRNFADLSVPVVRQIVYGMIPAGIVLLLHYYCSRGNTELFCKGLWYTVLPVFGAVNASELRRPLLWTVLLLGFADAVYFGIQAVNGVPPYGVTGNWNWSATLLAAALTAGAGLVRGKSARYGLFFAAVLSPWILFGIPAPWRAYFPKGTAAAVFLAAALRGCGQIPHKMLRCTGLLLCGVLLLGAGIACSRLDGDLNRSALYDGTVKMVRKHPLLGVGPGRFESEIPSFLPASYYEGRFPAERHPHPHNELLYWAGQFGLAGVLWFGCMVWILYRVWRAKPEGETLAIWLIAALLTLHGFADVLLDMWPCDALWLLATGVLWGGLVPERKAAEIPPMEQSPVRWPLRAVQALLVFFFIVQTARSGMSGFYARRAQLAGGHGDWAKSRVWRETPQNLYAGALHALFDRKSPEEALSFLKKLETEVLYRNYLHNQGLTARALAASGKPEESLPYFEREQRNYPVSAVNLYFYGQVLYRLGRTEEAGNAWRQMREILASRGRTPADLPALIQNPALELSSGRANHE